MSKFDQFLVDDGYATSLTEAAVKFVISSPVVSTALIGISSMEQVQQAVMFSNKGSLPAGALDRLRDVKTI